MAFYRKRDHIQIAAEILSLCENPQTKSNIKRHTTISYGTLQSSITQLLRRQWLTLLNEDRDQKKFITTEKGLEFVEKYWDLRKVMGTKCKPMSRMTVSRIQKVLMQST